MPPSICAPPTKRRDRLTRRCTMAERLFLDSLETPLGRLALVVDEPGRLRALGWLNDHERMERELGGLELTRARNPGGVRDALAAYFAGELDAIEALSVAATGTEFQRAVWRALREIPCGETRSYGEIATRIGHP